MFEQELTYFVTHQDELVAKYHGTTLVIRGDEVVGAYLTPLEAYAEAAKRFPVGSFMIQPCESGRSAYSVTINALR